MHRVGGIEKEGDGTGNISYTPENHQKMVDLRAAKVAAVAADIPPRRGPGRRGRRAVHPRLGLDVGRHRRRRAAPPAGRPQGGLGAPHAPQPAAVRPRRHPPALRPRCSSPSSTRGQLARVVRAEYLVDARSLSKVQGLPFTAREIEDAIEKELTR